MTASRFFICLIFIICSLAVCVVHAEDTKKTCAPGDPLIDITKLLIENGRPDAKPGTMECKSVADKMFAASCSVPEPKAYLLKHLDGKPAYEIERMGNSFACNLARFIDAGEKAGAMMRIYSGARYFKQPSANADCQRVPCVPSTHELGCAADLSFNGAVQVETPQCPGNAACVWAHQHVNEYQLQFRLSAENGFRKPEPWHVELAGAQGPASLSGQGYCPDSPGTPYPSSVPSASSATPPSSLANAMRNMFAPPPTPPVASSPINPIYDPTQYYQPYATPSPVVTNPPVSQTQPNSSPTDSPRTAVSDLITAIAGNGTTTSTGTTTATGTVVSLIDALGNKAGLRPGGVPTETSTNSISVSSLTPNDTFRSQDLSKTPAEHVMRSNSTFAILETLRITLLRLLSILKPFGGMRVKKLAPVTSEELESA